MSALRSVTEPYSSEGFGGQGREESEAHWASQRSCYFRTHPKKAGTSRISSGRYHQKAGSAEAADVLPYHRKAERDWS